MNNEDKQAFVIECLTDPANRDKQAALAEWLKESEENRTLYAETERIWEMIGNIPATPFNKTEGWEALSQHINIRVRRMFPWKSVAAVLLPLCIAAGFWWQHTTRTNEWIAKGTVKDSLILPDGSKIYAKPGTTLSYQERTIKLNSGEAFFEVVKNERTQFVVMLDKATVTVLGTSFNIKVDTTTEVAVLEGKISMTATNEAPVILTKGEMASLKADKVNKVAGNHSYNCGWVKGEFVFINEEAATVAAVMSAYYHTEIRIDPALSKRRITVKFSGSSLEEVKAVLAEVLDK